MKDALPGREDGVAQEPINQQDTGLMDGERMEGERMEGERIHWFDLLGAIGVVAMSAFVAGYISVKCF